MSSINLILWGAVSSEEPCEARRLEGRGPQIRSLSARSDWFHGIDLLQRFPVILNYPRFPSGSWSGLSRPPRLCSLRPVTLGGRRDKPGDDSGMW